MVETDGSESEFSLTRGGPLFALLKSTGLVRPGKREVLRPGLALAALTWTPVVLLAAVPLIGSRKMDPVVRDPAVHARLLVALPLFFLAEALLEERCATSFRRLIEGYARRKTDAAAIARRGERLRDSVLAEIVMLAIGLAIGQLVLWGLTASSGSGLVHGMRINRPVTASLVWYATVALPIFHFLLLRALYRWGIWSRVLFSLSRMELEPVPTHPDLAGGLGCVAEPVLSFAVIILANSAVVGATWGYRIAVDEVDLKSFAPNVILLVAVALGLSLGPLLFFSRVLWSARIDALREYSALGRRYSRLFHQKWIVQANDESLLGSSDISGLADLGTSYERVERMRIVPFGPRPAILIIVAALAPMLPILVIKVPLPELTASISRALLGGLPLP
jgi:hypothetical protein